MSRQQQLLNQQNNIILFALNQNENTFTVIVKNFRSYFYIPVPAETKDEQQLANDIKEKLNKSYSNNIHSVSIVNKKSLVQQITSTKFYKIEISNYKIIKQLSNDFKQGIYIGD